MRHALGIYDILRIDHFRGFDTYWAIPAGETTAKNGRWEQGPGMELFRALRTALGDLPIVAEDLGELFDSVRELLKASGFPGMKVLQFGLDGTDNEYLPHNYPANCVCYPGTHDNDTLLGWWENGAAEAERKQLTEYLALTPAEGVKNGVLRGRAGQPGAAGGHPHGGLAGPGQRGAHQCARPRRRQLAVACRRHRPDHRAGGGDPHHDGALLPRPQTEGGAGRRCGKGAGRQAGQGAKSADRRQKG